MFSWPDVEGMTHLHQRTHLNSGDTLVVDCSHQCNVHVMSDMEYRKYKSGGSFRSLGGGAKRFPVRITVPTSGHWNVTLDLGGRAATIKHSIQVVRG